MKHINYIIYFFFALFLGTLSMSAQSTKIQDESIAGSSLTAVENSILELESTSKGFLMPRMTNAQRNEIPMADKIAGNGLTIYNTDTDCINYWSTANDRWMSLCGTLPPSIVNVDASNCNSLLLVNGRNGSNKLMQGEYLTPSDILYVNLTVGEVGHYDITAVTDNGYYFSGSGTFNSKGSVRIPLTGVGVPIKGGVNDAVKFSINGKVQVACSNFKIEVERAGIDFDITSTGIGTAEGKYYWNTPVDQKTNFIDVNVNVKTVGAYTIKTKATQAGLSYSGSGVFTKTGAQTVKLLAEGTPKSSSDLTETTFELVTNSNGTTANTHNFKVKTAIEKFAYTVDLSKTKHYGPFVKGKEVKDNSYLIVEVKVTAPPRVSTYLYFPNGDVTFKSVSSNFQFNNNGNIHKLRFNASGTLPNAENIILKVNPPYSNTYTIPLSSPPVEYTIDCSSLITYGSYTVGKNINNPDKQYASIEIDVKVPGSTTLVTEDMINGIGATFSGKLTKLGKQRINLVMAGTPKKAQKNVKLRLYSADLGGQTNCFITLDVQEKLRDFNILVIGDLKHGPASYSHDSQKLMRNRSYFGPTGRVQVKGFNIFNYTDKTINTSSESNKLSKYLTDNNIDIVFVSHGARFASHGTISLIDFINQKDGVVIFATSYQQARVSQIIEAITGQKPTSSSAYSSIIHDAANAPSSLVLQGPEGFPSLIGKNFGNYVNNAVYWKNLPKDISVIARRKDADDVWAGYSQSKGFAFIGDEKWMTTENILLYEVPFYISGINTAAPRRSYTGSIISWGGVDVYNSNLFINLLAWAIEYRQDQ
ncbi:MULTISPECIES: hypothetical protein [unclassified Myroides]|uniref:hypothetical protein n=1 Tax=unclassified Myroides TaxID=2642485 RepID=UPI0031012A4F